MKKIFLVAVVFFFSIGNALALDIDPITQTKQLLDQYAARVKFLENENSILREEMRKAGIQIPLDVYSGAMQTTTIVAPTNSSSTPSAVTTPPASGISVATGTVSTASSDMNADDMLVSIEKAHGASYAGFVKRIISEWTKVRDAYALPVDARIGGYEFVLSGAMDYVFVDITYSGSTTGSGIFDAKILYQFDKTTFARKLIGFFEYNKVSGYYITKTGKNIFPGVKRTFILDTRVGNTISTSVTPSTSITPTTTGSTTVSVVSPAVTISEIEAAYAAKRFLSVISLSNTWLANNAPSLDVLRIRYRTYFIIAKYSEALKEIEKIRSIGQLSSAVACEGYVIATYAKDTTLADSYKATCNKK